MKKVLIIFISCLFVLGLYSVTLNIDFINKVEYELINDYKQMSLDSEGEDLLTDDVVVRVKLDYEEFQSVTNTSVLEEEKYRNEAKDYYYENNKKYLSSINLNNYKSVYVSKYTPYIEFTYERDKYFNFEANITNELNKNINIDSAFIKDIVNNKQEQINYSMYIAGASSSFQTNTNTYTGWGIKVGVLEPGLVDGDAGCFSAGQVINHYQNVPNEDYHEHTTHMAGYIAGIDGIAREAKIYSSFAYGTLSEEFDWLMDKGVHVINMSYGDANPTGYYGSDAAYCDYIVNTYKVTMVGAVGNFGNSSQLVGNPALGYNVIGVGSGNDGGYPTTYSSYIEHSGGPKPTVLAYDNGIRLPSIGAYNSGTSVACAVVTGLIALLMQEYPVLKQSPELVMSTLVTSAYQPSDAILMSNGLTNSGGAGLVRYDQFHHAIVDYAYFMTNIGVMQTFIYNKNLCLSGGEVFKVGLAWTAYTNGTPSNVSLTNYDLYLYDSEGNLVASSCSTDSNIELLQVYIAEDGDYVLKIKQVTFISKLNEKIALTYGIMPNRIDF